VKKKTGEQTFAQLESEMEGLKMISEDRLSKEARRYGDENIEVTSCRLNSISELREAFPELSPGVTVENGILIERDISVVLRDGVTIYTDVLRPEGSVDVPAIVAWGPYGKRKGWHGHPIFSQGIIPEGAASPLAKFEGPDPAYWCKHGYGIVNVDPRGVGNSQGDLRQFCKGEGEDACDLIEWVAAQPWCSGKVGMSGNSWLAVTQWYAAAEKPPHLAAIAPWEGAEDFYRSSLFVGGIPETGFPSMIIDFELFGNGRIDFIPDMMRRYPLMNGYWEERIAQVENIGIPAYVVASWTNPVHTKGTFDGYKRLASQKWLRVHNTHEWPDYYTPENVEDLRRFFDRFLKGMDNGWEMTPRVRLSILDPGGEDVVNRPENEFPLERTQYRKFYLHAGGTLLTDCPIVTSQVGYKSDDGKSRAVFTMRFDEDTELTGHMKLHLWVEADGANDMDLFVYVSKLDVDGSPLPNMILRGFVSPGARGMLRVSHREVDETRSTPADPYFIHRREQLLKPGEIVAVDIPIWPIGMFWHKGQQLQLTVQGYPAPSVYKDLIPGGEPLSYDLRNRGVHIIRSGGGYDSHLLVPMIPLSPH